MIKVCCLAAALALIGAELHAQDVVDLTVDQSRDVARQALFADDPRLAMQIAEAILSRHPDDHRSLLIVAAAAPRLGDPKRGREAGTRAWALSTTDLQKYEAARLTALAAANEERYTLSTFWLRRALTVAPNDAERTRTRNDARGVASLNPWSTTLTFSLIPSSNVNGGAEDADIVVAGNDTNWTISADGLALAGWRATLGKGTQYRFHQNAKSRSLIGIDYQGSRVWLTEDTNVTNESLRTDTLQASLRHERALENGTIGFSLSHTFFQYRQFDLATQESDLQDYQTTRLIVDRRLILSDETLLSFSASQERTEYGNADIGQVDRQTASGGVSFKLESGDRVGASLSLSRAEGDNANYTSNDQSISASYNWAEPIGPVTLSLGGGFRWSDYPVYRLITTIPGGRQDKTVFANLSVGFPNVSYAGFTPGLRIDALRAESNVSRFNRSSVSAGFTMSSSF
jgi:hypothetical protein